MTYCADTPDATGPVTTETGADATDSAQPFRNSAGDLVTPLGGLTDDLCLQYLCQFIEKGNRLVDAQKIERRTIAHAGQARAALVLILEVGPQKKIKRLEYNYSKLRRQILAAYSVIEEK